MAGKLSARAVATTKAGRYGDGAGLWLVVSKSGARKWVFRFSFNGRVTEAGLGAATSVSLAEARNRALSCRQMVAAGKNPIEEKRKAAKVETGRPTFGAVANALIESKASEWKSAKHLYKWRMTLDVYCKPIREKFVDEIGVEDVLSVLQPIWISKAETATKLRGRIEAILDAARARGHIHQDKSNPARWKGHLDKILSKPLKLTRGHHPAMPYEELPAFMIQLRKREAIAAMALEFTILTAARSGETLGAKWVEIDLAKKIWTIPADRMKAGREHRVPLSGAAIAILQKLSLARTGDYVFSGRNPARPLSGMAMEMLLRRMKIENATVHGFRSSFRDCAGNETHFPREIAEAALAHSVGNAVEAAYRRSDALEKRRELMTAWSNYIEQKPAANVLPMARARP